MIINIRGTSGSGKTWIVEQLREQFDIYTHVKQEGRVMGYTNPDYTMFLVGRYESDCGGCDTIKLQDDIVDRVRRFSELGKHVIFEGLLVSHIYGRYAELCREYPPGTYKWLFLDTPLGICLERVAERRKAKGNMEPLNPYHTELKWHAARQVFRKAEADGFDPQWINYQDPMPDVLRCLP
jgi:cytidylate kinase